jgi:hypothetical protein
MKAKLVSSLLEFIYIGSVNVEKSELKEFIKIAEVLQIKGLSNNSKELINNISGSETNQTVEEKKGSINELHKI